MKANTRGTTGLKKPEKASAVTTNNCSPKNISESSCLNFNTCFKWQKHIPGFSAPHCKAPSSPSPSFRAACPQNSDNITKPNLVPEFPAPQFPISLMGITTRTHFPSWNVAEALKCHGNGRHSTTHAPPCRLRYSAEMQMDQQLGQRKPPPPQ